MPSKSVVANMAEGNKTQEFRLENMEKTKNYFLKVINQNELMSRKHKKNLLF